MNKAYIVVWLQHRGLSNKLWSQRFDSQVRVNGPNEAPVYKFLKASKGGFLGSSIKWNFTKFLVDKEGQVIRRYGSTTPPLSIKVSFSLSLMYIHTHTQSIVQNNATQHNCNTVAVVLTKYTWKIFLKNSEPHFDFLYSCSLMKPKVDCFLSHHSF